MTANKKSRRIVNRRPRRIMILGFHESDSCFRDSRYKGKTGVFTPSHSWVAGYFSGDMVYDNDARGELCRFFYAVRYKRLPELSND